MRKSLITGIYFLLISILFIPMGLGNNVQNSTNINDLILNESSVIPIFGYSIFDPSGQVCTGPIYFESINQNNLICTKPSTRVITGGTAYGPNWYVSDVNGRIWDIDWFYGDMALIGETGVQLNALTYSWDSKPLYGASDYELYTINPDNFSTSLIGPFDVPDAGEIIGLAYNTLYEKLYGIGIDSDSLYSIDEDTGQATLIGPLGIDITNQSDIEFKLGTDELYLSAFTDQGQFYYVDCYTGECALIGEFKGGVQITGLAFHPNLWSEIPSSPDITGPSSGKVGVINEYTFTSYDPSNDYLQYFIDWGDNNSEWTAIQEAGIPIIINHSWKKEGTYIIKAKAKDEQFLESPISVFEVKISNQRSKAFLDSVWLRFLDFFPILQKIQNFFVV